MNYEYTPQIKVATEDFKKLKNLLREVMKKFHPDLISLPTVQEKDLQARFGINFKDLTKEVDVMTKYINAWYTASRFDKKLSNPTPQQDIALVNWSKTKSGNWQINRKVIRLSKLLPEQILEQMNDFFITQPQNISPKKTMVKPPTPTEKSMPTEALPDLKKELQNMVDEFAHKNIQIRIDPQRPYSEATALQATKVFHKALNQVLLHPEYTGIQSPIILYYTEERHVTGKKVFRQLGNAIGVQLSPTTTWQEVYTGFTPFSHEVKVV